MNPAELKERLRRPTETLQLELKSWVGLETPVDKARIARALIALRNRNGGLLVIGFNNKTLTPDEIDRPAEVQKVYAPDLLQKLVADYVEPTFPITVEFIERDGKEFPVVGVPAGVKSPAMGRQDVKNDKGQLVLRQNQVYVRSTNNDVVQTTEPRSAQDWDELMGICFDNREADVGRFLRRNMGNMLEELGLTLRSEQAAKGSDVAAPTIAIPTPAPLPAPTPVPTVQVRLVREPEAVVEEGAARYTARVKFLRTYQPSVTLSNVKAWRETGIVLTGPIKPLMGQHLLQAVFPRHPKHSGWPMWVDTRGMGEWNEPYPSQNGWEALVTLNNAVFVKGTMVDFWRIDPAGEFYHRRSLEDDLWPSVPDAERGKGFDIINAIKRVAEGLATVQAFAQGLSADTEAADLRAAFRWTNLSGRKLFSMDRGRDFFAPTASYEDVAHSSVEMPVSTASGAISSYVNRAVSPLFLAFGYQVPRFVVDELTAEVLRLRM